MNLFLVLALLLCFVSGFTLCFLLGCAIYVLKRHNKYQFQRTFAIFVLLLAVAFFSYFLYLAGIHTPHWEYINNIMALYDYIVVGFVFIFAASLVYPDRFSRTQLLLLGAPFMLAVVLYAITQSTVIFNLVLIVTPGVSLAVAIQFMLSIRKHTKMLQDNVGDIEHFDLRWVSLVLVVIFVFEVFWSILNFFQYRFGVFSLIEIGMFDIIWCLLTMGYVGFITRKVINFQIFEFPPEEEIPAIEESDKGEATSTTDYYHTLANSDIDQKMAEHKYYHDPTLTLQKLAIHLGTNRQYLSNYINKEKNKTFYEYINDYRLEEAKSILDGWGDNPQQSIEEVASMAGFNSYSTFFRSFVKKYNITPSKYLKDKE